MSKRVKFGKYRRGEITHPALATWLDLVEHIMHCDETATIDLLEQEKQGRARKGFLRRIHCRLNRVRAIRERAELKPKKKSFK